MGPVENGAPTEQATPSETPPADQPEASDPPSDPPADVIPPTTPPAPPVEAPPVVPAMAIVTLPFAELDPTQRLPLHLKIDANGFTIGQRTALMRYHLGCLRDHCKLANGRPVVTMADSARYWLEKMNSATSAEAAT